jgi:hypothetical protein
MPHSVSDHGEMSAAEVERYCKYLFSSLPRSDQRRWATLFIHGLLTVPGRKTIRKISDLAAGGGAEQCLQQFINQSTWRWEEIRCEIGTLLSHAREPMSWVVLDVVLPKNGSHSAGVDRQFAPSEGRVLNCQMGIAVFLVGDTWCCPVNWRLVLPPCWDSDKLRRAKAHVPDEERAWPSWQHTLDAIDEMAAEWGLAPAPIVADVSNAREQELNHLLRGFEERSLPYVVRVAAGRTALVTRSANTAPRRLTYGQLIADSVARSTSVVNCWQRPVGRPGRSRLVATRLPGGMTLAHGPQPGHRTQPGWPAASSRPTPPAPPRHLVAEWSLPRRTPRTTWLTSLEASSLLGLPDQIARYDRAVAELGRLYDGLGLRHFEGRSFAGWHRYATLVSVAAAVRSLSRPGELVAL